MKKFFRYIIPTVALAVFLAIMLSGEYLKRPRNPSEDVMGFAETTLADTALEDWNKVIEDINNLEKAWKKIVPRIQFSVERDEIYNIQINIAHLKGGAVSKDKSAVFKELYELRENWDELTK